MAGVILIVADDMRADLLRFMPYTMGVLRAQGTLFNSNRVSVPACSPARAGLASGVYAFRPENQVYLNEFSDIPDPNDSLIGWLFDNAGPGDVVTGMIGKYTIPSQTITSSGLNTTIWRCFDGGEQGAYNYTMRNEDGTDITEAPPKHTLTKTVAEAGQFVSSQSAAQDWFCWFAPTNPHISTATLANNPIGASNVLSWFNWDFDLLEDAELVDKPSWVSGADQFTRGDQAVMRRLVRQQIQEVIDLDHAIEQLVATIPGTEVNNTTVIFTSDSGTHVGEHRFGTNFLASKGTPYEVAMRAPLVCWGPDFRPGRTVNEATTLQDITQTITNIFGRDPGRPLDGLDLRDPIPAGRATLYEHTTANLVSGGYPPGQGVATGTRKFVRWDAADPDQYELYDLVNDPGEKVNRAYDGGDWLTERNALETTLDDILAS